MNYNYNDVERFQCLSIILERIMMNDVSCGSTNDKIKWFGDEVYNYTV